MEVSWKSMEALHILFSTFFIPKKDLRNLWEDTLLLPSTISTYLKLHSWWYRWRDWAELSNKAHEWQASILLVIRCASWISRQKMNLAIWSHLSHLPLFATLPRPSLIVTSVAVVREADVSLGDAASVYGHPPRKPGHWSNAERNQLWTADVHGAHGTATSHCSLDPPAAASGQ